MTHYSVDIWGNTIVLLNPIEVAVLKVPVGRLTELHQKEILNQMGHVRDILNGMVDEKQELHDKIGMLYYDLSKLREKVKE